MYCRDLYPAGCFCQCTGHHVHADTHRPVYHTYDAAVFTGFRTAGSCHRQGCLFLCAGCCLCFYAGPSDDLRHTGFHETDAGRVVFQYGKTSDPVLRYQHTRRYHVGLYQRYRYDASDDQPESSADPEQCGYDRQCVCDDDRTQYTSDSSYRRDGRSDGVPFYKSNQSFRQELCRTAAEYRKNKRLYRRDHDRRKSC